MISKFTELGLSEDIARALDDMGWEKPSPIQRAAVPLGLAGRDLVAQAQTGTGKTGAFGTLILQSTPAGRPTPTSLILEPTRELALQVSEEIEKMSRYTGHRCIAIYGGASIEKQAGELKRGADIIAGTPGRVRDMISRGYLDLAGIGFVVMDESDRMLDMGFIDDIEFIFKHCPGERRMMMFSATMPEDIKRLAMDYMKHPKELNVSKDEIVLDLTKQYYISVGRRNKSWALTRIIDIDDPKALIFCQTIKMVDTLEQRLKEHRYKVVALHGDMPQARRERVVDDFREGKVDLLIATDVAARGLDIDDIGYVINYDMPEDLDTYIHRIGRTGRAGKEGTAVSFVTSEEEYLVGEFELRTGMRIEKRDVPDAEGGQKDTIRKVVDYDQLSDAFGMVRFSISLGKRDGIGKVRLADYINRAGRIMDAAIGKIEIGEGSSVVEVHKDFGNRMLKDVPKTRYRGKAVRVDVLDRERSPQDVGEPVIEHLRQVCEGHLYLQADPPRAHVESSLLRGGSVNHRPELPPHAEWRATAMDVARHGEEVLRRHHRDRLLPHGDRRLLQIQLPRRRHDEHVASVALALGHERLEHAGGLLAEPLSDLRRRQGSRVGVIVHGVSYPRSVEDAHRVRLVHERGSPGRDIKHCALR